MKNILQQKDVDLTFRLNKYEYERQNLPVSKVDFPGSEGKISCNDSEWELSTSISEIDGESIGFDITASFKCLAGYLNEASVSMELIFNNWSKNNYVLLPAAAYNGNRYNSRPQPYMPFFYNYEDVNPGNHILLSDVPRLNIDEGLSRIQERSGSMSTPSIGFCNTDKKKGFLLLTNQGTKFGDHGISIEENRDRTKAWITLTNPVVRELFQYNMTNTRYNSMDVPANFKAGDVVLLKFRLFFFECQGIQGLFDLYNKERNNIEPDSAPINKIPYSEAFEVLEEKFNRQNYVDKYGYYAIGLQENPFQDWQIGWTGGMISTYPLLMKGSKETQKRVVRNFDWLFEYGISPGGLFWGIGEKGTHFFGEFEHTKPLGKDLVLVRKIGDAIYYIIKQFMLMEKMGVEVKAIWKEILKDVIDKLTEVWNKNQQMGHYLNVHTNEIVIGGSTSGGIIPAALCLAAEYYNNPIWLEKAEEIALHFYEQYVQKGITYGGVGDAMHNFDSESSYGLLESFALLYEYTNKEKWLKIAEDMASQFASWIINYDYNFPEDSLFGKLKMQTRGTVFANTQNKHLAPGICTHSGIALLRLFRATCKESYINLLKDIVRTIPQFLAHPERPIEGMQKGWMSERVNSTDWWEPIGEIFCGSTWSETSCMLSYAEVPGIYVIPEKKFIVVTDNLEAEIKNVDNTRVELKVINKTEFNATTSILLERIINLKNPLGENAIWKSDKCEIKKGETKTLILKY